MIAVGFTRLQAGLLVVAVWIIAVVALLSFLLDTRRPRP